MYYFAAICKIHQPTRYKRRQTFIRESRALDNHYPILD